jgi:hypothetical protein
VKRVGRANDRHVGLDVAQQVPVVDEKRAIELGGLFRPSIRIKVRHPGDLDRKNPDGLEVRVDNRCARADEHVTKFRR